MAALVLALDVGSSSARAQLRRGGRAAGPEARLVHGFRVSRAGAATAGVRALVRLVLAAVDGALEGNREPVAAVGISWFWHGLLGTDAAGRPVTPVLTWADTRAAEAVPRLAARLDPEAYRRRTGAFLHASFWPAKLELLGVGSAARWEGPAEALARELFGVARVGTSMAAGTGLLDSERGSWDATTIEALALDPSRLPQLSDEPLGPLPARWARRWPSLRRALWYPALGDGACANLGSGCLGPGLAAVSLGTSAAMRVLAPFGPAAPPGLFAYALDPPAPGARRLVGGATSAGGNLWAWTRAQLREVDARAVDRMAPDAHGLTVLPYLAGDRAPAWSLRRSGVVHGLTLATTAEDLARALLEAVALGLARVRPALVGAFPGSRLVVSGGASSRAARLVADALGEPVWRSPVVEASLSGAAVHALERLGRPARALALRGQPLEPDAEAHSRYLSALKRQDDLLTRL